MSELHVADGAEMFHWCSQEQGRSAELIKQGSEEKTETVLVYLQVSRERKAHTSW